MRFGCTAFDNNNDHSEIEKNQSRAAMINRSKLVKEMLFVLELRVMLGVEYS